MIKFEKWQEHATVVTALRQYRKIVSDFIESDEEWDAYCDREGLDMKSPSSNHWREELEQIDSILKQIEYKNGDETIFIN